MIQTFTQTDLIRYIYNEMDREEQAAIHEALLTDEDLHYNYMQLKEIYCELEVATSKKYWDKPSQRTIDNVLAYSKSLE